MLACLAAGVQAGERIPTHVLAGAAPNTWVKIIQAETGGREQPVFVYASQIKRFVLAAGMQHYGGVKPRHYDTEEFDLARRKWINAYPHRFH